MSATDYSLSVDIERLERINRTVRLIPAEALEKARLPLRPVKVLFISPSLTLERIAARFVHELPPMVRFVLRPTGAMNRSGSNLVSYLLFDKSYTCELMAMGHADAQAQRAEIVPYLAPWVT